jgi:hypothetical protein
MRAALIASLAALLALPFAAAAAAPIVLSERQIVTLELAQPVQRLAVSDPEAVSLQASGSTVKITGQRPGRVQLEVVFADGATATFDLSVEPLRRAAVRPVAPDELELAVGQERIVPSPTGAQVLLEDNGVARARVESRGIVIQGVAPGAASLVVVDPAGGRTTWKLRVR